MATLALTVAFVALVALTTAVPLGHAAARHRVRRQRWRHWAHRAGVLWGPACGWRGCQFGSHRQRVQLAAGLPVLRPSIRDHARIVASHARHGLHAACATPCATSHTYRRPCALASSRNSP
ncbi:hypothetical protein [Streptomyces nymphaeiformis]|uniref:Uncharacterized protein n=1 Tax=Streptomyces nymphaeiformis TaxID=2663842 RepID=A0A7W7UA95_9ACTN|nr:hypothetical protein [Streptomyces nymphaeiformis]MBB4987476.1 hypothetical protein [Streptomyces nymphaeiformis]